MTLIGPCSDCGASRRLWYKPGTPVSNQSRPSVCARCRDQREARATTYVRCEDCADHLPESRATTLRLGHPCGLSETSGTHGASGYPIHPDAEHAIPLAGLTYRARTRYCLDGPTWQAKRCQRGRGIGPLSRVGILALQGGEDFNPRLAGRIRSR